MGRVLKGFTTLTVLRSGLSSATKQQVASVCLQGPTPVLGTGIVPISDLRLLARVNPATDTAFQKTSASKECDGPGNRADAAPPPPPRSEKAAPRPVWNCFSQQEQGRFTGFLAYPSVAV